MSTLYKTIRISLIITIVLLIVSVLFAALNNICPVLGIINNYVIGLFCSIVVVDITTGIQLSVERNRSKNSILTYLDMLLIDIPDDFEDFANENNKDDKTICEFFRKSISNNCNAIMHSIIDYCGTNKIWKQYKELYILLCEIDNHSKSAIDQYNDLIRNKQYKVLLFKCYDFFKDDDSFLVAAIVRQYEQYIQKCDAKQNVGNE